MITKRVLHFARYPPLNYIYSESASIADFEQIQIQFSKKVQLDLVISRQPKHT